MCFIETIAVCFKDFERMAMLNRRMRGAGGMMPSMYTGAGTDFIFLVYVNVNIMLIYGYKLFQKDNLEYDHWCYL